MLLTRLKVLAALLLTVLGCGGLWWQTGGAAGQDRPARAAQPGANQTRTDAQRLQGFWEVLETTEDGETRPVPVGIQGRLVIEGHDFRLSFLTQHTGAGIGLEGGGTLLFAPFKLNAAVTPRHIDLTGATGRPGQAMTIRGIYELDGDDLRLCLPRQEPFSRPAAFRAEKGANARVLKLRRLPAAPQEGTARARERQAAALEQLKGKWRAVYVETTDQTRPEQVAGETVWEIADGKITRTFSSTRKDSPVDVWRFRIDPLRLPSYLDMEGEAAGMRVSMKGIYQLNGDELTVCLIGADGGRPSAFVSRNRLDGQKGGNMLLKFRRVNPAPGS